MPYYHEGELMSRYHTYPTYHAQIQNEYLRSWQYQAEQKCQELADEMGTEAYAAWAEQTWPHIEGVPYAEIYETAVTKLLELGAEDSCTCRPDGDACPACRTYLKNYHGDELPY
jgi:hypothetical protein